MLKVRDQTRVPDVVKAVKAAGFDLADSLDETPRGAGGFGSTGAH